MASEQMTKAEGRSIVDEWIRTLNGHLRARELDGVRELFVEDSYWRDVVAFTWDLRTFSGPERIARELTSRWCDAGGSLFEVEKGSERIVSRPRVGTVLEFVLVFRTEAIVGRGFLRLAREKRAEGERWSAWTLFTEAQELIGFEEAAGERRPRGHSGARQSPSAVSAAVREDAEADVLVVGGAQSGLSVAARLGALGVRTVVVERSVRIGDNWRDRYQSLVLHNQVWANHLPYMPFPSTWPVYIDKDQLADWLEAYAALMGLDVRTSSSVRQASYDEALGRWRVEVIQSDGSTSVFAPRHVVLATGVLGPPLKPKIPGLADFAGAVIHATEYSGEVTSGSRVLVVGSGSSAHDVAQDLHLAEAQVTMLQRTSTCVVSLEPGAARAYSIYRENGVPTELADLVNNSFPLSVVGTMHIDLTREIAELDRDLLDGLRARGFALDFGDDGSGFLMKHQRRGGGYYINVGCSDLIIQGKITVKQGVEIVSARGEDIVFSDGEARQFDMVVVAAGYHSVSVTIGEIFGDEVAKRVGPVWGLDDESELNAMWRPTGQTGLWIMGGSLQQVRPYSKTLALQIKAEIEGISPGSPNAGNVEMLRTRQKAGA